jgi:hypothetical protein
VNLTDVYTTQINCTIRPVELSSYLQVLVGRMCIQFEIMIHEMFSAIVGQCNDWQIRASMNVPGNM